MTATSRARPPAGIAALIALFAFGVTMCGLAVVTLLVPGSALDGVWRINPAGREAFLALGRWAPVLLVGVAAACGSAAAGLWRRARWGRWLAVGILGANLVGDLVNAVARRDPRTLIGLPIASALIAYLLSARAAAYFARPS